MGMTTHCTGRDKLLSGSVYKARAIPALVFCVADTVSGISIVYPANASCVGESYVLWR